eukprot:CAMPEP_0116068748 /NCGR_PEP_ID=MMETSP0322-20121206/11854_1 /TAXON_ID=163516 /ORGANISM="Leptocylindrus danicus var. apora, Strain B651" /LENGTH=74 /DNA_ID=CAMNT_0003555935 /DNA_START=276 /DNA_END=500 /DNA_ORIENTATION=-
MATAVPIPHIIDCRPHPVNGESFMYFRTWPKYVKSSWFPSVATFPAVCSSTDNDDVDGMDDSPEEDILIERGNE